MGKVYKSRRVFKNDKIQYRDTKTVKNPMYDAKVHREWYNRGLEYPVHEYVEKEVPIMLTHDTNYLEHYKECEHCGTKTWVRRKDAKYCTPNCRKLAYLERRKAKESTAT